MARCVTKEQDTLYRVSMHFPWTLTFHEFFVG